MAVQQLCDICFNKRRFCLLLKPLSI